MTKLSGLGKKRALVKVFMINNVILGFYKRSSARKYFKDNGFEYNGTHINSTHSDLLKAENNIIDPENKYLD